MKLKHQEKINETIEHFITSPTGVIKNKIVVALMELFYCTALTEKRTILNLLEQKRDLKLIRSAGGSGYCVY